MKKVNRLGRGLSALIPSRDAITQARPGSSAEDPVDSAMHHESIRDPNLSAGVQFAPEGEPHSPHPNEIRQIPVSSVTPNRYQPRTTFREESLRELAESIRTKGVLQPILVRVAAGDKFEIVAGERRWRAATLAGLEAIPAIVRELSDSESFELALVENLQREDLGPLERATAYQHYLEAFGGTIEDLAQRLSESRANVSNYLRLLKLRPEICYMLGAGELGMGQARAIAGIVDPQRQLAIAKLATRRNLSVRQVEELARRASVREAGPVTVVPDEDAIPNGTQQHVSAVEAALSKALGLRVRLRPGRRKNSGRIIIAYNNLEEFDRVAERLGGDAHLE